MPYKDPEKRRENSRAYREKNKEELDRKHKEWYQKNKEELRRKSFVYRATHKEVGKLYRATHKEERVDYYKKNKEELNRKGKEYYQKNKASVILRTNRNAQKNITRHKKQTKQSQEKIRLESLTKVDPSVKCALCGCDDTRFLEINHINGGGNKEYLKNRKEGNDILSLIRKGKRDTNDLNLLCRACNSLDHLERVYGKTGLSVVWDKKED